MVKEETFHIIVPILIALMIVMITGIEGCAPIDVNIACTDTATGDIYTQGKVESGGASMTDFCLSSSEKMDYYCSGDVPITNVQDCRFGCKNGACLHGSECEEAGKGYGCYGGEPSGTCPTETSQVDLSCAPAINAVCCKMEFPGPSCITLSDCAKQECDGQTVSYQISPDSFITAKCEYGMELSCTDNSDNDGDGLIDGEDPDCQLNVKQECEISDIFEIDTTSGYTYFDITNKQASLQIRNIGGVFADNFNELQLIFRNKEGQSFTSFVAPAYLPSEYNEQRVITRDVPIYVESVATAPSVIINNQAIICPESTALLIPVEYSCIDSDDGEDYFTQGTTTKGNYTFTDYCSGTTVHEGYCDENGEVSSSTYNCIDECSNGACI